MPKILIVDDSETLRIELKGVLENNGHEVLQAENGAMGMEVLTQSIEKGEQVDLIVLDINMPEMDGITMCEKIQDLIRDYRISVIMLTTEARPELKEKAKSLGVRAWVTKPFVADKFLLGMNKLFSKGKGP